MRLLLAEDEEAMSEAVVDILEYHRYQVDAVYDGAEALDYIHAGEYDGIILDIMMPKRSGLEVLRQIRSEGCRTPVLLLTAKSEIEDRIEGLDLGADDYLAKPFHMGELLARIRAMLRRREEYTPDIRSFGDVTLNPQTSELSCNGRITGFICRPRICSRRSGAMNRTPTSARSGSIFPISENNSAKWVLKSL